MRGFTLVILMLPAVALVVGCEQVPPPAQGGLPPVTPAVRRSRSGKMPPLVVQQVQAYPEAATGRFVGVVDFEDAVPGPGPAGHEQVKLFAIDPIDSSAGKGRLEFVVNITRTGTGAMEVHLPPQSDLALDLPYLYDLSEYTLLSMSIYVEALRDDLELTLITAEGAWTSRHRLLRGGWNTVMFDVRGLRSAANFDHTAVESLRLRFADATSAVRFNLDDILLINNYRRMEHTPLGIQLYRNGLDYRLNLPGRESPIILSPGNDGLWRLGDHQPVIQLLGVDSKPAEGEQLDLMGPQRMGFVEILESNRVRLRIANTWFFPTDTRQLTTGSAGRIRWEYTFYCDGRWISQLELNNSGGAVIDSVRIMTDKPVAWAGRIISGVLVHKNLVGGVGRWCYINSPALPRGDDQRREYLKPGRLAKTIADEKVFAPGDAERDGFDESQGCYFLTSPNAHCRFTISPAEEGELSDPVFRVVGRWTGPVHVNSEGLVIRNAATLADGSVVFVLPGAITRTTSVELGGHLSPAPQR